MNHNQVSRVELNKNTIDCIAFWTKDATPMVGKLDKLNPYPYFIQFTINPYGRDIETNLRPKRELIESFKALSREIGNTRMIWRYSPILIQKDYPIEFHLEQFAKGAQQLAGYTCDCRISFLDMYSKISKRMAAEGIRDLSEDEKKLIVKEFVRIGRDFGIKVSGCGNMDLASVGLETKACIDPAFVASAMGRKVQYKKDPNQRDTCYCMPSVDIGVYNTCLNGCKYCYANWSEPSIKKQANLFDLNSEMLCDRVKGTEKITNRKIVKVK